MSSISRTGREGVVQRRTEARRRSRMIYAAAALGLTLMLAGALMLIGRGAAGGSDAAAFEYSPEDVARGAPVLAVHEMGQGPAIPFLPADGPQPRIAANETFVDVGSVGPNEVIERSFVVANLGEATLTISRAYTTCGCTTAEISSAEVPAGKVVEITMIFDAGFHDTRGQTVRRGLIIENNDPQQPIQEIWLQATVRNN